MAQRTKPRSPALYNVDNTQGRFDGASERLSNPRFPRASKYHPDWVIANASGGANALQLADWLSQAVEIRPEMRVLDLGCGKASTSIFFAREFGCQVYACDLWFSASDNQKRIVDAGS